MRHEGDPDLAPYLLDLHDELDRLDAPIPGRAAAWVCVILGGLFLLGLLRAGAPSVYLLEFLLVTGLPAGYLAKQHRSRARQRQTLMARIDTIERTRRSATCATSPRPRA